MKAKGYTPIFFSTSLIPYNKKINLTVNKFDGMMLSVKKFIFIMAVLYIKKDDFKKEVLDFKDIVLVDFYADWCGPCKAVAPIIDELSNEVKGIKFVKVNVDEAPGLATQFSIFSIPTFVFFKNGQIVNQFSGAASKDKFIEEINNLLTK